MCFHRDLGSGGLIGAGESPPSKRSLEHKLVGRMRVGEGGVRTVFPTSSWNRHVWEDPQLKVSLIAPSLASLFVSSSGNGRHNTKHPLVRIKWPLAHSSFSVDVSQWPFTLTSGFQKLQAPIRYRESWDFPGGPMAKIPCSQCRGPGFNPWSGN